MDQKYVVPRIAVVVWIVVFGLAAYGGARFLIAFSIANLGACCVFMAAASRNLSRMGRRP